MTFQEYLDFHAKSAKREMDIVRQLPFAETERDRHILLCSLKVMVNKRLTLLHEVLSELEQHYRDSGNKLIQLAQEKFGG